MNPFELAERASTQLRDQSGVNSYDLAVVLGSGWREGASALAAASAPVATSSLAGFVAPTVAGHSGQILSVVVDGRHVALVAGRVHLYEGNTADQVVHPVRTVIAAGARVVVLTNACGGIDPSVLPGSVVVIRDHINLTAASPLEGASPPDGYGSRFVDLTDLYSAALRQRVREAAPELLARPREAGVEGRRCHVLRGRATASDLLGRPHILEDLHRPLVQDVGLRQVRGLRAGVDQQMLDSHPGQEHRGGEPRATTTHDQYRHLLRRHLISSQRPRPFRARP